jgi:peptidoglycan hydrolase-like protein with peptidoglycan-binding domain
MRSYLNVFVVASLVILALTPALASAKCFERNLSLGMVGEDVRTLQKILNASKGTQVAEIGPGSLGNESTYFGGKTKMSVAKFQELYRKEILDVSGLASGNGFVGPATRKTLETLCSQRISVVQPPPSLPVTLPASTTAQKKDVYVLFPSVYSGIPGAVINISGDNFSIKGQNTVYFGPYKATSTPQGTSVLLLHVPTIPPGRYPIWVENEHGASNKDSFFIVRDPNVPEPTLTSVNPATGKGGTVVEVRGTGFLPSRNELRTGIELKTDLMSDGTMLRWTIPPTFSGGGGTSSLPVWIYVVNDRGVSNPLVFQLQI